MEINLLKINGFGKLKDKEIKLDKKINIIYGKNEQGKTSTLKFLNSIFYGASKNKNGKEISDFEKYKPWDDGVFSGKIIYTLDNNEQFEIYREFNKKNPKIFNSDGEEISKNFNIDKNRGIQFFEEQTGIDEGMFNSSTLVEQKGVVLDKTDRRNIMQKISNLISTGEENISYKKTIDKLNKKYIEEVGTDRTTDRPLNNIKEKINDIKTKIKNIEINKTNKKNIEIKKNEINKKINDIENEKIILNKIKKIKEKIKTKNEEIKIKNNLIEENKNKINLLDKNYKKNKKNNKKILLIILLLIFITAFLGIINLFLKSNYIIKIIISTISILLCLFLIINKLKINKKEKNKISNEKNIIEKIINELNEEINNSKKEIFEEEEKEKNNIYENNNELNKYEIENLFNNNLEKIENIIKNKEEEKNNCNFQKYKIEIEEKELDKNIEEKIDLEEKLENLEEQERELINNGEAIKLAKEILEKSYNKMKNNITPGFKKNILKNKNGIIGQQYKNIVFNEEEGIKVELENGNYVNANLLSTGTIDQLHLALRLATMDEITKERMPIILDEPFVYYDDERLENILNFLNNVYNNKQIIIFTCSKREIEILDKNKINYNFVEL